MSTRKYQPEPMHRIPYTQLSSAQVQRMLRSAGDGPGSKSELSTALVGKQLKIVTDSGPTLTYNFRNANQLRVSENGGAAVNAGYGALASKQLLLVSHTVPGTQRGYQLVIDQDSRLVTVFETWFSGYRTITEAVRTAAGEADFKFSGDEKNREVQREVYYGYIDDGTEAPAQRHHLTNRMEGRGVYWKQDTGVEILEFYCSVIFSNFIELTRHGGELTFCGPSDYIMINDHQFIYSRVEAEFSGMFSLHIVDLFDVSQAGVRLGINEKDELEYYLYTGKGEVTGQIATFEVFGDNGEQIAFGNRPNSQVKGQRIVYRPLQTFPVMTDDEVREQVLNHAHAFGDGAGSGAGGMGGYKSPQSDHLAGKNLTVRMDNNGPVIEYRFEDMKKLHWRYAGDSNWREAWYEAYEPDEDLYFFAHLLDPVFPRECAMVLLDMKTGLSTCLIGRTGTQYRNNETTPTYHFGVFEMEGITAPGYHRHGWTDELVGEAVTWNYQPGDPGLTSMHLYLTPNSYSWVIFLGNGSGGPQWSSPGWYAKIREDVFLMAWVEEACNGTLGVICFNRRTMHDAGFGYHVGPRGLSLSVVGARARHAGRFNIKKYIGPRV